MQRFGELLDSLVFQPARNEKLRLIVHYLKTAPDPDRGYALAALTGALDLPNAKPAVLRALGAAQTDEVLFALSYDYVAIWPRRWPWSGAALETAPRRASPTLSPPCRPRPPRRCRS